MPSNAPMKFSLGQSWLGGSTRALIASSIALGAVPSNAAAVALHISNQPHLGLRAYLVMALGALPFFAAIAWLLLVDTSTIRTSADPSPESIETTWMMQAGHHAFLALMVAIMVVMFVFTTAEVPVGTGGALGGVLIFGVVVYGLHYLRLKKQAS